MQPMNSPTPLGQAGSFEQLDMFTVMKLFREMQRRKRKLLHAKKGAGGCY
jgi:hypothetical protein